MPRDTSRGHRGRPPGQHAGEHSLGRQIDAALLGSVDAGLAAVLFAVPLILGGRIALGQLVLVGLTFWIAVCWCIRQCLFPRATWIRSAAEQIGRAHV